jgi:hypothetical protein
MDDSRTPIVTAPVDLILSKVALDAIAPCAQTSAEATNAALIPDTTNDDTFILKLLIGCLYRTAFNNQSRLKLHKLQLKSIFNESIKISINPCIKCKLPLNWLLAATLALIEEIQ